jgi:hypothetical protein
MQKLSVAKKMPRKFQAGGKATAPALTGMDLERENARRDARVKKEKDAYEAQRPNSLGPRPAEKPEVKKAKGGSIRKFYEGGDVREGSNSSISDDTRARAQRFLETGKKDDGVATKATYKPSPKNVSTVNSVAKPAPAKTPDKEEAKPTPVKASDKTEIKPAGGGGTEPDVPSYRRDAPTLGNRDKSGREQKFDFNAENAATAATLIPGIGAAARLGQGAYRTGKAAYEGAKGLAEGVKSGVSVAKGLNAAEKSREAAVGAREASNRLANARAADKAKKAAEEAAKQSAKDKKDAGPIFKAAKVRADFNRIDKVAAAKKEAGFKKAAEERRASRTSDESTKMADEGNPNYKKGGAVKKFAKGGMARGYGISKVTNKTKYC